MEFVRPGYVLRHIDEIILARKEAEALLDFQAKIDEIIIAHKARLRVLGGGEKRLVRKLIPADGSAQLLDGKPDVMPVRGDNIAFVVLDEIAVLFLARAFLDGAGL